jgi:serine/threonine-protein kinase
MSGRICPECDTKTEGDICAKCGSRTLKDRSDEVLSDPMPGRILEGRYRIEALIGKGGMGAVYRGIQLATKQVVAIKIIRSEHTRNLDAAKRFHREARAASLLAHPHTIRVFDFGESEEGDLFMVLEYLSGRTLGRLMKSERCIPAFRVAKIGCEVAQALTEAHSNGLVHRDLKPENVMLLDAFGDPDFVKVLDFGIAKFLSGDSGQSSVTGTGMIVGTPHYMAPEQASGSRFLSTAIDVYALGVMIHEALTGTKPFDGETPLVVMMAHVRNPLPKLPADLDVP